ncbi:MAG: hypothetical protein HQL71_06210 [Magnetococcales bacterium]|nr:hypothetical protein [Magnetococcales bacterium]
MQFVYFTAAGIFLYVASDWLLLRIEAIHGKRLPNRSVVFFGIILILSMITFEGIKYLAPPENSNSDSKNAVEFPADLSAQPVPTGPLFNNPAPTK